MGGRGDCVLIASVGERGDCKLQICNGLVARIPPLRRRWRVDEMDSAGVLLWNGHSAVMVAEAPAVAVWEAPLGQRWVGRRRLFGVDRGGRLDDWLGDVLLHGQPGSAAAFVA